MRTKILLLIAIILITIGGVSAQYAASPLGLVLANNTQESYFIETIDDKNAETIYSNILVFLTDSFVSPQDVISKVDNKAITINGVTAIVSNDAVGIKKTFSVNYTLAIQIKDGKLKINNPSINSMKSSIAEGNFRLFFYKKGASALMGNELNIFDKKGQVKRESAKIALETYFNKLTSDIISSAKGSNDSW